MRYSETGASDERLQLRPDLSIIPHGNADAILYYEVGESLIVSCPELDVARCCAALLRGATEEELLGCAVAGADQEGVRAAVADLVGKLDGAGALLLRGDTGLPEVELRRFDNVVSYLSRFERPARSRFEMFAAVREAHVLMIGVGGLGSATLAHLVASGVGRITVADHDVLETSNLARQTMFGEGDVGRKKIEAAAAYCSAASSFTEFEGVDAQICGAADIEDLLSERPSVALVIQSADRPIWSLSKWIASAALATGVPVLHSSYLGVGPLFVPGRSACAACLLPSVEAEIPNADEVLAFQQDLADGGLPRAVTSASLAQFGAVMANEALMFLSGACELRSIDGMIRVFPNGDPGTSRVEVNPDRRCAVCGGRVDLAA